MKAYGHSRKDKLECKFGCCTGKSGKKKNGRTSVDRSNRKTARQYGQFECNTTEILYEKEFKYVKVFEFFFI